MIIQNMNDSYFKVYNYYVVSDFFDRNKNLNDF
jgi:hypothetical protein